MKRNSMMEKATMVLTIWCLLHLVRHIFITENLGWTLVWLALALLGGAQWGYWSEEKS